MPMVSIQVPPSLDPVTLRRLAAELRGLKSGDIAVLRGCISFCEGLALSALAQTEPEICAQALSDFVDILKILRTGPAITLAVVQGACRGGGVGIAGACDIVVASPEATFSLPEVLFGLYPAVVLAVLQERVLPQTIRLLALTGDPICADQALQLGVVDVVTEQPQLSNAEQRWLRRLGRASPNAATALKRHPPDVLRLVSALEAGRVQTLEQLAHPEVRARVTAFEAGLAPWSVQ